MSIEKKTFGAWAENQVAHYLTDKGFTIVVRNYRKRGGEIDIIAYHRALLVFVEVKARTHATVPLEALIMKSKQQRISTALRDFLLHHPRYDTYVIRCDVALIHGTAASYTIDYIENAFYANE